jgi:hypothetical protein
VYVNVTVRFSRPTPKFQDVDIVWYQEPLAYFQTQESEYDMIFQDDGARSVRYAPYSPNTGFYYVRYNERTKFFMNTFVRMGDLVLTSGSHQGSLTALLSEHASWRGLKVKVVAREESPQPFPGGFHFHKRKDYMKALIKGEEKAIIFHMSWTKNKENKRLFFQQLGEWHVLPTCETKFFGSSKAKELTDGEENMATQCCSAEPIVACHYGDKPSKFPCKDTPPIDKGKKSFW